MGDGVDVTVSVAAMRGDVVVDADAVDVDAVDVDIVDEVDGCSVALLSAEMIVFVGFPAVSRRNLPTPVSQQSTE